MKVEKLNKENAINVKRDEVGISDKEYELSKCFHSIDETESYIKELKYKPN